MIKTMSKKKTGKKAASKRTGKSPDLVSAVPIDNIRGGKLNFITPNLDIKKEDVWQNRVFLFTPSTGSVRMEWVQSRYAQMIPTNWSFVEIMHFLSPYVPIGYQLADAQNLMAKYVVEGDYQWIIYIEHDNILPPDAFVRFNQYINEQKVPVVSGLYFTKAEITEPLIYRGKGTSYFGDWKMGDKVWADGIPFGFRLEHAGLVKAAWENSEEYTVNGVVTRRVFKQPGAIWYDEEKGGMVSTGGTTDLAWCARIMEEKLFEKAGWPEYQKMKYPFLVDTNIFVKHIDQNGNIYPRSIPGKFVSPDKNYKGKVVK